MSSEGLPTVRLDRSRPGWEYALVTIGTGAFRSVNIADMNRKFDEYGDDGWELVSLVNSSPPRGTATQLLAVFKRPKL